MNKKLSTALRWLSLFLMNGIISSSVGAYLPTLLGTPASSSNDPVVRVLLASVTFLSLLVLELALYLHSHAAASAASLKTASELAIRETIPSTLEGGVIQSILDTRPTNRAAEEFRLFLKMYISTIRDAPLRLQEALFYLVRREAPGFLSKICEVYTKSRHLPVGEQLALTEYLLGSVDSYHVIELEVFDADRHYTDVWRGLAARLKARTSLRKKYTLVAGRAEIVDKLERFSRTAKFMNDSGFEVGICYEEQLSDALAERSNEFTALELFGSKIASRLVAPDGYAGGNPLQTQLVDVATDNELSRFVEAVNNFRKPHKIEMKGLNQERAMLMTEVAQQTAGEDG